jgi:2Fe-2S ferredoxin
MGGSNPYMKSGAARLPARAYTITFLRPGEPGAGAETAERTEVRVEPEKLPYSRDGQKGSILEIALGHGVDLDHACGGVCACSTCHVIVRQGLESCGEASDDELDQLEKAPGLTPQSRLACQSVPDGSSDLVVEVPNWNRNFAREGKH